MIDFLYPIWLFVIICTGFWSQPYCMDFKMGFRMMWNVILLVAIIVSSIVISIGEEQNV